MKFKSFLTLVAVITFAVAVNTSPQIQWPFGPIFAPIFPLFGSDMDATDGYYSNAAVACDSPKCAKIGTAVLSEGGSVADAAIAMLLCMGVVSPQSLGLGGGFFAIMYNASSRETKALNSREVAGSKAKQNMFQDDPSLSQRGALSVAIPGEMKGYWELYKKAGKLPWSRLLQPTIDMCKKGIKVTAATAAHLKENSENIIKENSMREIFVNPLTNDVWKEGDTMRRPVLAKTLETIAKSSIGGDDLYQGELGKLMASDLEEFDSILTLKDIKSYRVKWEKPINFKLKDDLKLQVLPPPSGGLLLGYILSLLNNYLEDSIDSVTNTQRIIEAFKHAFAKRTVIADPSDRTVKRDVEELVANFTSKEYVDSIRRLIKDAKTSKDVEYYGAEYYEPEDHGTGHVSIVGANGDAIAVTSTINLSFGAQIRSRQTGIIFNDQMDDFSAPNITNAYGVQPSPNNFIKPGKRPLSSMSPSIITDSKGKVRLVIGSSGGPKSTTTTALIAMRNLWFNQTIKEAIDAKRIHHQFYPMEIQYEDGFSEDVIKELKKFGHEVKNMAVGYSVCGAVARYENGTIFASSDFRKAGSVAGY